MDKMCELAKAISDLAHKVWDKERAKRVWGFNNF